MDGFVFGGGGHGYLLAKKLDIENTGLRGHQFVKEGSEEVLELRSLQSGGPNFNVNAVTCIDNILLLIVRWQEDWERF